MAVSQRISMLIGGLLLIAATISATSKTTLIDDEGIESIAESVCKTTKGSHVQIGRVSTIAVLVAFFQNLSPNHKLAACNQKYKESLAQLYELVNQGNENVCGEQKISLIEKFHHNFVSGTSRDKSHRGSEHLDAPRLFVLFFMQYATKISATCKQSMFDNANTAALATKDHINYESMEKFVREFSTQLGATSSEVKGYDEMILLWNLVDRFSLNYEKDEYVNGPGFKFRVFVQANSIKSGQIDGFQKECSTLLKPAYKDSVLPVLRLADLGYYQDKEQFAKQLAARPDLKRSIEVVQLCEALLPVVVVEDRDMETDEVDFITKTDRNVAAFGKLKQDELSTSPSSAAPEQNNLVSLSNLDTATPEDGSEFVKSVASNIANREKVIRHLITSKLHNLRGKAKSLAGKLFSKSKGDKGGDMKQVDPDNIGVEAEHPTEDGPLKDLLTRRRR